MKDLGMSWSEIKATPRNELIGLLTAYSNHEVMHAFDGYSSEDVNEMAKNKPEVRGDYARSLSMRAKYEARTGMKKRITSFADVMNK